MMRKPKWIGFAGIAALLLSILPLNWQTAYAAGSSPGVSQFATAGELLTEFDTDSSTAAPAKTLYFGKNSRQWYLVGEDSSGGGLVLYCTSSLGTSRFHSGDMALRTDGDYKYRYNSWHLSLVRSALQGYYSGTSFFSDAEKALMMTTTVTTTYPDVYLVSTGGNIGSQDYQTTDVLYLGTGTLYGNSFALGSDDSLVVSSAYMYRVSTSYGAWLRTAVTSSSLSPPYRVLAYDADTKITYSYSGLTSGNYIVPAFQLDVSSLNFASVVPAGSSGSISTSDSTPFTLRWNATESFGTATVDAFLTAVSVSDAENATLVIQNAEGAYAVSVNGTVKVSASEVTINGSALESFDGCKIWLERTSSDGLLQAVMASTLTMLDSDTAAGAVYASYLAASEPAVIYSVDISWGSLSFTWQDGAEGAWDPESHSYAAAGEGYWSCEEGANQITVANSSNAAVSVRLTYAAAEGFSAVSGSFDNSELSLVTAEGTAGSEPPQASALLTLSGAPENSFESGAVLGTVTITLFSSS